MEIICGEITTEKIHSKAWRASTQVTKPFKSTVNMIGKTEQDAIDKLKKFFDIPEDEKHALDKCIQVADKEFKK